MKNINVIQSLYVMGNYQTTYQRFWKDWTRNCVQLTFIIDGRACNLEVYERILVTSLLRSIDTKSFHVSKVIVMHWKQNKQKINVLVILQDHWRLFIFAIYHSKSVKSIIVVHWWWFMVKHQMYHIRSC